MKNGFGWKRHNEISFTHLVSKGGKSEQFPTFSRSQFNLIDVSLSRWWFVYMDSNFFRFIIHIWCAISKCCRLAPRLACDLLRARKYFARSSWASYCDRNKIYFGELEASQQSDVDGKVRSKVILPHLFDILVFTHDVLDCIFTLILSLRVCVGWYTIF